MKHLLVVMGLVGLLGLGATFSRAQDAAKTPDQIAKEKEEAEKEAKEVARVKQDPTAAIRGAEKKAEEGVTKGADGQVKGDSAWLLVSTAFVMLMVPGLALFYGGMVRRKNILSTMMQSMVCLSVVGVWWIGIGYALAFGAPWIQSPIGTGSILGFSKELVFLQGISPTDMLPGYNIPVYLHVLYQGMFAIITPALISGAIAERIRFKPYLIFTLLWVTVVYAPLAHMVWSFDFFSGEKTGAAATGVLGVYGALDFAGGTVVHIAAGVSSLAAIIVLRKRLGYPERVIHPSSMVLTLTGAGLLWFGWFGFNGGSGLGSGTLAVSAFAATQAAAAAAGLSWMFAEWVHRGKPTALGFASGIVAGLVAVTPAAGFVYPIGGLLIGLIAGVICYLAVLAKAKAGYDDSLDAFGVHGVGGTLGAVLTGVFCYAGVQSASKQGLLAGNAGQFVIQIVAALVSIVIAFVISILLVKLVDALVGFTTDEASETDGLDRSEHGETGFDIGLAMEAAGMDSSSEPRPANVPPAGKRYTVVVEGPTNGDLIENWAAMCQPGKSTPAEFKEIYPYMTTVQGNRFQFKGGDPNVMKENVNRLFQGRLKGPIKVRVE